MLVPFFHKAYTIDDPIFLSGAAQVLRDPLHPSAFTMAWMTDYPAPASRFFSNSPLMFYLLVPVIAAGGTEGVAHLLILCFFWTAILGTVSLGLRLGMTRSEAAWSGILLASTPAVLVMASTAMPDIPAMTLGVWGLDRLTAWRQSRTLPKALAGGLLLALAALSRSHMILLTAVCFLWLCEAGTNGSWRARLWPLLLPPILFALALRLTAVRSDGGILQATHSFTSARFVPSNLLALLTHFVWVLPLTIPWALASKNIGWKPIACLLGFSGALIVAFPHLTALWLAPLALLTALALLDLVRSAAVEKDRTRLFLSAWLFLPILALPYIHLPSKYLVPSAPAVALLIVACLRGRPKKFRYATLAGTVAAGLLMGLLILRADANLAGALREGVAQLIVPRIALGQRVWFYGTWGFYWYSEQAGARPLSTRPPVPAPGDIIVSCSSGKEPIENLHLPYKHLDHVAVGEPGGRIFGGEPSAGFYSNYWGYLPWSWGRDPLTTFDVWQAAQSN